MSSHLLPLPQYTDGIKYCLSFQISRVDLHYTENAYHKNPYNKNHYHTIEYIKCMEKMLVIQFSYIFENQLKKKRNCFCDFLRTVEQQKLIRIFFLKKCLPYSFHIRHKNFSVVFWKIAPKISCFHFCLCLQSLMFYVHNVVLDKIILDFFSFHLNFFLKNTENSNLFCMACFCMPWFMSDNLQIQNFKIIIVEKFYQKFKVCYFCYIICERQLEDNSGRFLCLVNARPSNLWCFE